jgi:3D (Asp-Asp-Asp) domain-containing protein
VRKAVGLARTRDGGGYWVAGADGGIFSFGDARFYGSTGAVRLNQPIVGMAATGDGRGYRLVAADGGIFTFGGSGFYGRAVMRARTAAVAVASTPDGAGYLVATGAVPKAAPPVAGYQASPASGGSVTVTGATGQSIGTFVVTCYDLGGSTATGVGVNSATVAVDPSIIPLGTHIYVDGAGSRIAEDTGGAIKGRRLDIWEPSYGQCAAWGVQSRQVWLQN